MNRNRLYMSILILSILTVIIYSSYQMQHAGREEEYYSVSVIVNDSSSDRWNAFKEGLEQGAEDNHIYLNIVSTSSMEIMEEESAIISREFENGADGIILQPCSSEYTEKSFTELTGDKPIVLVESDLHTDQIFTTIMTAHKELGSWIAKTIKKDYSQQQDGLKIGVFRGNPVRDSQMERYAGFAAQAEADGAEIIWTISKPELMNLTSQTLAAEYPMPDVIVCLDNEVTEIVIDYFSMNGTETIPLYAVGRSEKSVYYLDKEWIHTLFVPNEYYMGYESISTINRMLREHIQTVENIEIEYLTVTSETMYRKEYEKILFPTVR